MYYSNELNQILNWDNQLDFKNVKIGTPERMKQEIEAKAFMEPKLGIEDKRKLKAKIIN